MLQEDDMLGSQFNDLQNRIERNANMSRPLILDTRLRRACCPHAVRAGSAFLDEYEANAGKHDEVMKTYRLQELPSR